MRISFRTKLILSYLAVVLISFGTTAFFLDKKLEDRSVRAIEASLVSQARLIEDRIVSESPGRPGKESLQALAKNLSERAGCRVTFIDNGGRVLADSEEPAESVARMSNHMDRPEVRAALGGGTGVHIRRSPTLNIDMLYVAIPVTEGANITGVIRLALPLESVERTLSAVRKIILMGLLFAIALAVTLGCILAYMTIKPIDRMIHVSRRFSEGDFGRRIIQAPSDEIGELALTLNKMAQDIEDKIKELGAQNQRMGAVFNSMIEGVLVVDRSARILSVNQTITKIFGVKKEEAEGRLFLEAIRNNDMAAVINDALRSGRNSSAEVGLVYPVRGIYQVNATPIFDGGSVNGCLAVIHDITEIRRLETVRSDFVANVSHELKTPLTSIKGFVETLLEGALEDKENARAFLSIIQEHADRLDRLVSDLLALSHLESKEMKVEKSVFDLKEQVDSIIMGFGSQLKKKGIEARNALPAGFKIKADRERIGQVVTNLIDNAIKFNKDKGSIKICSEEDGLNHRIIVEDSGIGIPPKDLARIFERFYRVDKARSADMGGTGLGLSIVKHIIEMHAGSVGADSTEGFSSRFWFTIPK